MISPGSSIASEASSGNGVRKGSALNSSMVDDTIANILMTVTVGVVANEKINRADLVVDSVYFLVVLAGCSTRS